MKGGRCRHHIVEDITDPPIREALTDELDESLRRLQEVAERHAFFADQAMKDGGNGTKDAAFNRNARTAAQLAKTRMDIKVRGSKTKDGEARVDENTNIQITDNHRDDTAKSESEASRDDTAPTDAPPADTNTTEPDET